MAEHEHAEDEIAGEPPGGGPAGARPAGVQQDGCEQGQGGAGQEGDGGPVEAVVGAGLCAASPADDPGDGDGPGGEQDLHGPAEEVEHGNSGAAVVAGGGCGHGGRDGEQSGGGVCRTQPGHYAPPVPESGPAEGGRTVPGRGGDGRARGRRLGLVRAPRAVRQEPQQPGQRGRDQRTECEAPAGLAPPAAGLQEPEPGPGAGAGPGARALPGEEVERDLAGGRDQQQGEAEREDPYEDPVRADRARRRTGGGRGRPGPVGEVDDHEGQEQQPQGAGAVAGGEPGPAVGLDDGTAGVPLGVGLGVGVRGAAEHGGGRVPGDPNGARIVEQLVGRCAVDSVHAEFEGEGAWGCEEFEGQGMRGLGGVRHGGLRSRGLDQRGSSIPRGTPRA